MTADLPKQYIITLQNLNQESKIPSDSDMKKWASYALQSIDNTCHQSIEIGLRITDEEEISQLNHQYRKKSGSTNILSFPNEGKELFILDNPSDDEAQIYYLGDLVICAPIVTQEAMSQHKTFNAHWAHLIIHGILHLHGYDHETDSDALKMEALETQLLSELGFSNPYITQEAIENLHD